MPLESRDWWADLFDGVDHVSFDSASQHGARPDRECLRRITGHSPESATAVLGLLVFWEGRVDKAKQEGYSDLEKVSIVIAHGWLG